MSEDYKIFEYVISDAWGNTKYRIVVSSAKKNNLIIREDANHIFGDEKRKVYTLNNSIISEIQNVIKNNNDIFNIEIDHDAIKDEEFLSEYYFSDGEKTKLFRIANAKKYREEINDNENIKLLFDVFDEINNLINDNIDE